MTAMHPLAIVNTASITSLVRMTLYHHSISVYNARVAASEDVAVLGGKVRNAAAENPVTQLVGDIPGGRSPKNQQNWLQDERDMKDQDQAGNSAPY
jgi:hypothetical protein